MPTVPGVTASCAALRPTPTPAQSEALLMTSLSALAWLRPEPETNDCVRSNRPAAATKPPMLTPRVAATLRSVPAARARPKLWPPVPSIVRTLQSRTPATVDLFTWTSRALTKRSTPSTPTSDALATLRSKPVYEAAGAVVVIAPSVRLTPLAVMPTEPGVTALCAALRPPPTPAQSEALVIVSLSASWLVNPEPETFVFRSPNVPAAATKPSAMLTPSVPSTLSEVAPKRVSPRLGKSRQSSGVGFTPPVAVLTLTSRAVTKRSRPGIPFREAVATVRRKPVYFVAPSVIQARVTPTPLAEIPMLPSVTVVPVREPPIPAKTWPPVMTRLMALLGPDSGAPETSFRVRVKVPETNTKSAIVSPIVAPTASAVVLVMLSVATEASTTVWVVSANEPETNTKSAIVSPIVAPTASAVVLVMLANLRSAGVNAAAAQLSFGEASLVAL